MSELRKSVLNKNPRNFGLGKTQQDFSPLNPTDYFDSVEQIETDNGIFNFYRKGKSGPILCCLHGGGYSGLTWALFAVDISKNIECQIIALDLRGHGGTSTVDDENLDLATLSRDSADVLEKIFGNSDIPVILIGHSMGGAIAVDTAKLLHCIAGICIIDVVEGTALEALSSMQTILRNRPSSFKSLESAIQWCFKSGQTRNIEAARISMPGQVLKVDNKPSVGNSVTDAVNDFSIQEVDEEHEPTKHENFAKPPLPQRNSLSSTNSTHSCPTSTYIWRIDLKKTERYWPGWFQGLSQKFLDLQMPKILLLANVHGLDTTLTIGQMQGKFQFQVLTKSGHAIHEDQPQQVAEIISVYLVKHKLAKSREGFEVPIPKMFM
ncbi:hypothetical protein WA026_012205 [Henosepilachna vigintioctopunctata]|uniref:Protein phosphatase methylesterase 1 n=1 Tax=Henosepilachna vigintioctopunctata TaxID=420089 RepID=A0AAW1V839_9CUCU